MVLTAGAYALFLYARTLLWQFKNRVHRKLSDLSRREFAALMPFVLLSLSVGLVPSIVLTTSHASLA